MAAERGGIRWSLWLSWVLASTLGLLVGGAVGTAAVSAAFPLKDDSLTLALSFAVTGLVIGTAQWLVLRQHLSRIGWWILASIAGFAMFGTASQANPVEFALAFVVAGAGVGIAQFLVLRPHLTRAGWWVLACTLGFAAFGFVPKVAEVIFATAGYAAGVIVVLVIVAAYGGITGVVLVWLLRRPIAPKSVPKQTTS